jgi:hypothetical protein
VRGSASPRWPHGAHVVRVLHPDLHRDEAKDGLASPGDRARGRPVRRARPCRSRPGDRLLGRWGGRGKRAPDEPGLPAMPGYAIIIPSGEVRPRTEGAARGVCASARDGVQPGRGLSDLGVGPIRRQGYVDAPLDPRTRRRSAGQRGRRGDDRRLSGAWLDRLVRAATPAPSDGRRRHRFTWNRARRACGFVGEGLAADTRRGRGGTHWPLDCSSPCPPTRLPAQPSVSVCGRSRNARLSASRTPTGPPVGSDARPSVRGSACPHNLPARLWAGLAPPEQRDDQPAHAATAAHRCSGRRPFHVKHGRIRRPAVPGRHHRAVP